jgi:hypothetical protein
MTDPDAQPPVILRPQMRSDVFQTIVPTHAATELEAQLTGWDIELVMHHQNFSWLDAMKSCKGADRLAGTIHEGLRQQHPHALGASPDNAVKARLHGKRGPPRLRKPSAKPKPGIVPGFFVVAPWVTKTDNQARGWT